MSLLTGLKVYLFGARVSTPATPTYDPKKCKYPLDNDRSDTITLPDGRKLGYAQYGSLTGRAVLYQHGLPGSRLEGALFHDLGVKLGARIIATDRPGYGWSSPHPDRTLLDHPKDLEHLAKHLEVDEYSVLGISGGGPYVLACAKSLPPEKLKSAAIMCGLGPMDIGMKGAQLTHKLGFPWGYLYFPTPSRWFFQLQPAYNFKLTDDQRLELMRQGAIGGNPKDLEVVNDEDAMRLFLRGTHESFAQGFDGWLKDGKLMCSDWGFRIEDIRPDLPVQLWYGKQDTFVPLNHGEQIAKRLGGRAQLHAVDETHGSTSRNLREEVLTGLLRGM